MNTTEAVLEWLRQTFPDFEIGPVRDRETFDRGTKGFTIGSGETRFNLEVSNEFLDDVLPEHVWARFGSLRVFEEMRENPEEVVIVTTSGLRFVEH